MTRSTLCSSLVAAIVYLFSAIASAAAPANPHMAGFNKSQAKWKQLKVKCGGNYSYKVRWSSFAGFGNETTIVCRDNTVLQRKYREWRGGPQIVMPGRAAKPKEISWTETGAQIGTNKKGAAPKTLDELYADARKILAAKLSAHQKLYVRYDKQGLLKSCFYVDTRIADDAPRKGVMISDLTLHAAADGGEKKPVGKTISLTKTDSGKTIKAAAGDSIVIKLQAGPSTGFIWSPVTQPKGSAVGFKSKKFVSSAKNNRPMPGQGGVTTFIYSVTGPGKATIRLNYRRPWEKKTKPAARTFTVTVQATGDVKKPTAPKPASGDPKTVAARWLDGLGDKGLVIIEKAAAPGFVGRKITGRKSTMFIMHKPGWYMSLGFDGPIGPDTPLATLKNSFKYIALNQLPTPGLDVKGWKIRPQTPRSSFSEGVEFLSYSKGKIKFRVKTSFFALYGRKETRGPMIADAPSPKGTYFQIRKPFALDMTIEAPMAMK